jgi:hypothetical protein
MDQASAARVDGYRRLNGWRDSFSNLTTVFVAKEKQVAVSLRIAVSLPQRKMTWWLPVGHMG